jgi:hypothetical protein
MRQLMKQRDEILKKYSSSYANTLTSALIENEKDWSEFEKIRPTKDIENMINTYCEDGFKYIKEYIKEIYAENQKNKSNLDDKMQLTLLDSSEDPSVTSDSNYSDATSDDDNLDTNGYHKDEFIIDDDKEDDDDIIIIEKNNIQTTPIQQAKKKQPQLQEELHQMEKKQLQQEKIKQFQELEKKKEKPNTFDSIMFEKELAENKKLDNMLPQLEKKVPNTKKINEKIEKKRKENEEKLKEVKKKKTDNLQVNEMKVDSLKNVSVKVIESDSKQQEQKLDEKKESDRLKEGQILTTDIPIKIINDTKDNTVIIEYHERYYLIGKKSQKVFWEIHRDAYDKCDGLEVRKAQ